MIVFTEEKKFSREDVQELFLSVGWISGQYPGRLFKALMNSSTVVTAWDGDRLAGLVRVLDDSEMVAYMHYVLVHPAYQGRGIAGKMVEMVKEKYRDYLYLEIMPEESRNAAFYEKHGFLKSAEGQIGPLSLDVLEKYISYGCWGEGDVAVVRRIYPFFSVLCRKAVFYG